MYTELTADLTKALKASICPEPIIDSNGIRRDQYLNSHQLMSSAGVLRRCSEVLLSEARKLEADQFVGLALGGCALAGAMSALSADTQHPISVAMFRDRPKDYGFQGYLSCSIPTQSRVSIVDDVISTGTSALRAIDHLRTFDVRVVGTISVVRRGNDGTRRLRDSGIAAVSLIDIYDVLDAPEAKLATTDC